MTSRSAIPAARRCWTASISTIPAGSSLAIVGQNGAGKTTLAKLLCRLYDPRRRCRRDRRHRPAGPSTSTTGGATSPPCSRTSCASSCRCATTSRPAAAARRRRRSPRSTAPAPRPGDLDTLLAKGYPGGTDLSGGQWQRVALARALCAVVRRRRRRAARRADRPARRARRGGDLRAHPRRHPRAARRSSISHRFSTVRHADRICVLEHGAVVELGTHDELMALGGRYRTMFDLQASRFVEVDEHGEEVVHESPRLTPPRRTRSPRHAGAVAHVPARVPGRARLLVASLARRC